MNVLQVTAALEQGGVERGTVEMAAFIVTRGAGSFVASQGGRMVAELESQGSTHICLPLAQRNPFKILYSALQLKKIIEREKISLVHARSRAPAWAALLACRLTGVPFITTFHGTHRIQNRLKKLYNSSMVRGCRVIAISRFIRQHVIDNYGVSETLIDIAPRGFNPEIFNRDLLSAAHLDALKAELKLADDVPVISLPGRLTRWKGQELFLEALAGLKDLPWHAILIGGATKRSQYVEQLHELVKREGLEERVTFAGNRTDIEYFYALSDLVVSASMEPEAFGRVAVEAQALGVPVVASAHGGSLETIQDGVTGWYFENGNPTDLSAKIRLALSAPKQLEQVGKNARRWAFDHFTIDRMCRAEWQAYQKVLA